MINTRAIPRFAAQIFGLAVLCVSLIASCAGADGLMPMMPAPDTPVYWQLERITLEPTVTPAGGYAVAYEVSGLSYDLEDGLMAQSLVDSDPAYAPSLSLTIAGNDRSMQHTYAWTPLPVYLEPGVSYVIDVNGECAVGGKTLNTLFAAYTQGAMNTRVSADNYTGHPNAASFVIDSSDTALYKDGSLIISFILRDVNDMFRLRVAYTYAMRGGIKPTPTPIPGFVAVALPDGALPAFYDPAPGGQEALWVVTTAREEYRAYGSMSGSEPMFFPADREGNVVMNEKPASPQKDYETFVKGYVPVQVEVLPAYYELVGPGEVVFTTRDGERVTRKYGRVNGGSPAFYAVDETGAVPEDAERVDPAEDYSAYVEGFGAAKPSALPVHYKTAGDALYAFEGRDGETRYRVFGRLDGAEPAYYEAAAEGTPVKGAAPINPDDDFERYIKGFTAMEPKDPPAYYEAVGGGLFAVTDRVGQKVYRSYGVKDGCEPAYYSADERGSVAEDAAPVSLADDFERYIAGFEPIARDEKDVPLYYYPTDNADVWTFMDINGKAHFRVYGVLNRGKEAYYYPCDEEGNVNTNALPVRPASDLAIIPPPKFAEVTPAAVPDFYYTVREGSSLYAFADREGESIYRVFGAYGRAMPQFYPANAEGIPVEDAAPVDPEKDFEAYFKGFEPQPSKAVPPQYTLADESKGLYSFTARDGETLYRVYGTLNRGGAAGFFPADEEGNPISEEPVQAKAERALMSTPVTFSIITLRPRATPDSTPLVRIYTPKPKPAPTPAAYESAVPGVQITGTLAQVTREVTAPSPDPTAAAQVNAGPTEAIAEESAGEMATEAPAGSVAEEPVPETPATEEPTAELSAATETELPQTTGSPVETSSGLAGGWIALIVTAGAALLGGGGYAVFGKKKK